MRSRRARCAAAAPSASIPPDQVPWLRRRIDEAYKSIWASSVSTGLRASSATADRAGGAAFIRNDVFREFGPSPAARWPHTPAGRRRRAVTAIDTDARHIGKEYGLFATRLCSRLRGFSYTFSAATRRCGYDYYRLSDRTCFADELRFPIIDAALTPIGVIGGICVFFANIGGWFGQSGCRSGNPRPDVQRDHCYAANQFTGQITSIRHRLVKTPRPTHPGSAADGRAAWARFEPSPLPIHLIGLAHAVQQNGTRFSLQANPSSANPSGVEARILEVRTEKA
jgi:hypothetical protein